MAKTPHREAMGALGLGLGRQLVQTLGIGFEQTGHLVNKRTRSPSTGSVHALLQIGAHESDLGIFSPQLDDYIGSGVIFIHRFGFGDDLLDKGEAEIIGNTDPTGAGDGNPGGILADFLCKLPKDLHQRGMDIGMMAAVLMIDPFLVLQHNCLYCCRTYI